MENKPIEVIVCDVNSLETKESLCKRYYEKLYKKLRTFIDVGIYLDSAFRCKEDLIRIEVSYLNRDGLIDPTPIKINLRFVFPDFDAKQLNFDYWQRTLVHNVNTNTKEFEYVVIRGSVIPVIKEIVDSHIKDCGGRDLNFNELACARTEREMMDCIDQARVACCDYDGTSFTNAVSYIQKHLPNWVCTNAERMVEEEEKEKKKEEIKMQMCLESIIRSITVNEKKRVVSVKFKDGDLQMARCSEHDQFDAVMGVSICIAAHYAGSKERLKNFVADNTSKRKKK